MTQSKGSFRPSASIPTERGAEAAAHTPGPWRVVESERSQGYANGHYDKPYRGLELLVCGPAGATVITRRGLAKPTRPEGQANARLIAASPRMYDYIVAKAADGDDEAAEIMESIHASR